MFGRVPLRSPRKILALVAGLAAWGLLSISATGFLTGQTPLGMMFLLASLGLFGAAVFTPLYRVLEGRSIYVLGLAVSVTLWLLIGVFQFLILFSVRLNPDSPNFVLEVKRAVTAVGDVILIGWTAVEMLRMAWGPR